MMDTKGMAHPHRTYQPRDTEDSVLHAVIRKSRGGPAKGRSDGTSVLSTFRGIFCRNGALVQGGLRHMRQRTDLGRGAGVIAGPLFVAGVVLAAPAIAAGGGP
jgi:hypothetical protein